MLFNEPPRTNYDLNFPIFGFDVRVHPLFFVMPLLLGRGMLSLGRLLEVNTGVTLLILAAVFFLSILIHELGHAFAFRRYGSPARILLYWLGGLAIPDSGNVWSPGGGGRLTSNQHIVVSLAGPFFGLCFGGVLIGFVYLLGGEVIFAMEGILPMAQPVGFPEGTSGALIIFLYAGIYINILWTALNLLPVYPLDGGQVAREAFKQGDSRNGLVNSIYLSIFVGGAVAVLGLMSRDFFMAILFGYLAMMNYQSLMGMGMGGNRW